MLYGMDCLFILHAFFLTFMLGLPFVYLIPQEKFKNKYLISPLFGYGLIGLVATVTYRFNITHHHLYHYLWLGVLFIALTTLYKNWGSLKQIPRGIADYKYPLLIWFMAFVLILIPYWVGGEQFSIFQGWIHDQFSYMGTALTLAHEKFLEVNQSSGEFFIRSPTAIFGAIELYKRPGIEHILGMLSEVEIHQMYRFGYLLLAFMVANGMLAATFLMTNLFNCSALRAMIVSAAIFIGFWGQLYIDFNAWSMTGAMPLLLAVTTYLIIATREIKANTSLTFRQLLPLSFLISFAVYIYPENTIFHLPGLLAVLLLANVVGWKLRLTKQILAPTSKVVFAILLGFSATAFYFNGTIGHFIWAAGFSAQNVMTQAVYAEYLEPIFGQANWFRPLLADGVAFSTQTVNAENPGLILTYILNQIFVVGHFEILYYAMVDGFYGFFGMYFITPLQSFSPFAQEIWRGLLSLGIIIFVFSTYKKYIEAYRQYRPIFVFLAVLCSMLIFFLLMTRMYAMARGMYFVAPYCMIVFFIPFLISKNALSLRNSLYIFVILTQVGFGFVRINSVNNAHFYPRPYAMAETHYFADGKTNYDWNLSRFDQKLKQCHRVFVDVPNGWHQYGVTHYLYSKRKPFVKSIPVKTSFWAADFIGYQKVNGKEDCTFTVTKKLLANKSEFNELELQMSAPQVVPTENRETVKKS